VLWKPKKPIPQKNKEELGFFTLLDVFSFGKHVYNKWLISWQLLVKNMAEVVHSCGCNQ